jgi:hypothetical protein
MKILTLTLALLFVVPAGAIECPKNVQKVDSCWIVSEPQMQNFAKMDDELELQKKLQLQQEHLIKLNNAEIEYYKKQSNDNAKALQKSESQKFWLGVGAFALGVVLTGVAAKAAIEATK